MKDYDFDTDHLHAYFDESSDEDESLTCLDCDKIYSGKRNLHKHLLAHHIQQPVVKLEKIEPANPPLKITFKNRSGNSFEIVSPVPSPSSTSDPGSSSGKGLDEIPRSEERDDVFEEENFEFSITNFDEEEAPTCEEPSQESESGFEENSDQHSDLDSADPFASLGDPDTNTQGSSAVGSSRSSEDNSQEEDRNVTFSPNLAEVIGGAFLADYDSSVAFEHTEPKKPEGEEEQKSDNTATLDSFGTGNHANSPAYGSIPGAEPTPPPEQSPTCATEYPKLKVKTTGLFKDPEPPSNAGCTITEITDDNPNGEPTYNQYFPGHHNQSSPIWTTPSLEDPLKLPDFLSNNDRNKDMGYSSASSDSEFISLDSFNDSRNRGAMQLYNPNSSSNVATSSGSSLDSLTGLPMQALAQQVSRLTQNSSAQGMHQQNVLINIQQFPSQPQGAPMNQPYQHQPQMYPPHPGYPPHQPPPMHQPYPYQPPNPMYPHYPPPGGHYPPAPPHMGPPPQMGGMQQHQQQHQQQQHQGSIGPPPQGGQPPNSMTPMTSQPQPMPPPNQIPQQPNSMQGGYRPQMPPSGRPPAPRGPQPGASRMPGGPRGPNLINQRAPGMRPRAPMIRPRGAGPQQMRGGQMRPRMGGPPPQRGGVTSPLKRHPGPVNMNNANVKRKRVDVLTPSDKDDDDCQVICMQPKNTGLPQIESVQGAESVENSIMKLSDSITLTSVRPQPKSAPVSPQKSETAKAVANVLASRGITVTSSGKTKEAPSAKQAGLPPGINLNGSISIVAKAPGSDGLPTVDLTDEVNNASPNSPNKTRAGLPYRCDLCPATYPNAMGLNKHRQTYHKTNSGMSELGVPLVNLKTPGIMQKLSQVGINNYIPLQAATPEGTFAIPLINTKSPGNVAALGATQMLTLGPVRPIPRPNLNNVNSPTKKL